MTARVCGGSGRRFADFLLFGVTSAELAILCAYTPDFTITDWIYLLQHLWVLAIALMRRPARAMDVSPGACASVLMAYAYPYAQIIWLDRAPGLALWPAAGVIVVTVAAVLSLASLFSLGRLFGVRPALRGVASSGPYRIIRHPMYFSYITADIGYNLQEWNLGTVLLTTCGWLSLLYRIHAEERVLAQDARWTSYTAAVRYRLVPGIW
ncbi:MAG TPA: isoprenylcysteine carboxylmethyltransferase family protein [Terriglobia bacterium]|jgi:protein-S-isoprenylcysteine O-methyltransferase Ste14